MHLYFQRLACAATQFREGPSALRTRAACGRTVTVANDCRAGGLRRPPTLAHSVQPRPLESSPLLCSDRRSLWSLSLVRVTAGTIAEGWRLASRRAVSGAGWPCMAGEGSAVDQVTRFAVHSSGRSTGKPRWTGLCKEQSSTWRRAQLARLVSIVSRWMVVVFSRRASR